MDVGKASNPFSSHLVEPARGGYIFSSQETAGGLAQVMRMLERSGWRGELTGPHGAGKSTLLTDICNDLAQRGLKVGRWRCSDRSRALPPGWWGQAAELNVIAIDGAERLWPWLLWAVRLRAAMAHNGLIITTHRRMGIGTCIPVESSAAALSQKIKRLAGHPPDEGKLAERLAHHHGNSREVLFDMYLEYENQ